MSNAPKLTPMPPGWGTVPRCTEGDEHDWLDLTPELRICPACRVGVDVLLGVFRLPRKTAEAAA